MSCGSGWSGSGDGIAPRLVKAFGIALDIAAEMLVTAGDNTDRIRTEGAFAKICGACPIPAGSGMCPWPRGHASRPAGACAHPAAGRTPGRPPAACRGWPPTAARNRRQHRRRRPSPQRPVRPEHQRLDPLRLDCRSRRLAVGWCSTAATGALRLAIVDESGGCCDRSRPREPQGKVDDDDYYPIERRPRSGRGPHGSPALGVAGLAAPADAVTGPTYKSFGSVDNWARAAPNSPYTYPLTTVGTLFYKKPSGATESCTASVINTGNDNTVVTAGHCLSGAGQSLGERPTRSRHDHAGHRG